MFVAPTYVTGTSSYLTIVVFIIKDNALVPTLFDSYLFEQVFLLIIKNYYKHF